MKRKIRELKIAGFAFLLFALFACGIVASAEEETSITVDVAVQYGQTEAREMLDMINAFRASGAKCWDETDTKEELYTGLDALDYDYGLEQTAMQRAAEIALMFAHTRPNGKDCWTAYEGWQGTKAENIAAGSRTTEGAFEQWKEEGEPYSGQGHRRNMLNSSVRYIGIGHVIYNGVHFWVQEFGGQSTGVAAPAEADVKKQVPVEVLSSYITQKTVTPLQDAITLSYGDSSDLPEIDCKIQLKEAWPARLCPVTPDGASDIWTVSEGIDCIEIDEATNKIRAIGCGEAKLKAEMLGQPCSVSVTVTPKDITDDAAVTLEDGPFSYTGDAIEPSVTVEIADGTTLEEGKDYELKYSDNVNAGTASVTVSGKGNYSGSLTGTFVIAPRGISESECTVGAVEDQTYTGAQIRPAVEVFWNGKKLLQDTDYTITYDNNVNAGTANGSIAGTGNYSGAIGTVAFEILPADLSDCTLDPIPEQTFTGSAVEPQITVRFGSLLLTKNTDFLAAYENNVAEGTATVVLTGTGNYKGTISGSFVIKAKPQQTPAPEPTQTPSTTPSQTPAPESTQTPGGAQPSRLAVGTVKKDSTSAAKYKVKGNASGVPTVEYVAPSNKKKTSIVVPNTVVIDHVTCRVTSIAASAFKNNKKVKKIVVGKYVTSIGKNAFRGCSKLKSVKMGARVTEIKDGAFYGCSALTSVEIPSTVTKIGKQAFYNCKKLKKITIKTKKLVLKKVGTKAFAGINSKAVIKVPGSKKKAYKSLLRKRGAGAKVKIK